MTAKNTFHEIARDRIKATIWHDTQKGVIRFTVAFSRVFRAADRFWDAACFQRDDLPALSRLADDVYLLIEDQKEKMRARGEGTS